MQAVPNCVESSECAILREVLKSLDVSIQRNTDLLNQSWTKPPVSDPDSIFDELDENAVCTPDKAKAEKWYRNILKQLRAGRDVDAVFRQLLIVCQSYGFSLPPPPSKDVTLARSVTVGTLQADSLEVHELVSQIYTRLAKHYNDSLQQATNHYDTVQLLTCLSYLISPTLLLRQFHSARLSQINTRLPVISSSSELVVLFNRTQTLITATREMVVKDLKVFLLGVFGKIAEPNKIIRIVYLDRLTKELIASLQQLKSTNQLGTYFCDLVGQCWLLEQEVESILVKYSGLSLLEVVGEQTEDQSSELLWDWRKTVFACHLSTLIERVAQEKLELLSYIDEVPGDFWLASPCSEPCMIESCDGQVIRPSLGVHRVLWRLVKYNQLLKQLGGDLQADAEKEEPLTELIANLTNEVVAAILLLAEQLSDKVPFSRPLADLYMCYTSLHVLRNTRTLQLSTTTISVLQHNMSAIRDQMCAVNIGNIVDNVLLDEGTMFWSRDHTIEIKECSGSIISLNLYLRRLYYDLEQTLPTETAHCVMCEVLEKSLGELTRRYLAVKPSRTNSKLYSLDITAILMAYSTYIWLLTGDDVTQVTEPREGPLIVIYSHLNRLLGAMSVMSAPLDLIVRFIKHLEKAGEARGADDVTSPTQEPDSPVLPHPHATQPLPPATPWLPSVWVSCLFNVNDLDTTLLHLTRCFNRKIPSARDLLMCAISNAARIPQQIQLYHNRQSSKFEYGMTVLTLSRLLSLPLHDMSAWGTFILSTFIPNEIWCGISKPSFRFTKPGGGGEVVEDLWQECIGEVLHPVLEPILEEVASLVGYRTRTMPSTDEQVAIEELPCSCRINRFSSNNPQIIIRECLSVIFTHISVIVGCVRPAIFKLARQLANRANLKENSEVAILKLFIAFFLKRLFYNPNAICKKYEAATEIGTKTKRAYPRLPFTEIPEGALVLLRKVGDITRLIIMKHVLDVVPVPAGAEKYLEEEEPLIEHSLSSLHEQLALSLFRSSCVLPIQLNYDISLINSTYPGIFSLFLEMMGEVADIIIKDYSSLLRTVKLLPVNGFNPMVEYTQLGGWNLEDIAVKQSGWDYDRLSEYFSERLLLQYLPSRWELKEDTVLSDETTIKQIEQIKEFLGRHKDYSAVTV